MKMMTHRQRLRTALDHQELDFVPLDFGTGGNTSPVPEVYQKLASHFQVVDNFKLVPHIMRLAVVDERILQSLDIDTRPIYMNPVGNGLRLCQEQGCFYDEWGVKWREYDNGGVIYREVAENPLQYATIDDLEKYPWWPDPLDPNRFTGVKEYAEQMFYQTDYALVGCPAFNSLWERAYFLCGFARMLESLMSDLVGPYVQVVKMGDDLGAQDNALMSPVTYRKTIKPYHQELFRVIKARSKARVFLHTCGSVYKLLPELIDAGVDILNPVQVSAKDMDTRRLKLEYGDSLSFWGAIDTQLVLPFGSIDDVKEEVQQRISDLGCSGGYIVAPVHNIQADVPVENVLTMYQHARQCGRYPLLQKE